MKAKTTAARKKAISAREGVQPDTVEVPPPGYITANEFAERMGIQRTTISRAMDSGNIPLRNLRWVLTPGRKTTLYLDWVRVAGPWLNRMPAERRPAWTNPLMRERPVWAVTPSAVESDYQDPADQIPAGYGSGEKITLAGMGNLNSAKLRTEQLKIQRQELDLLRARNQVLDLADVGALLQGVATEIRQRMLAIVPRLGPVLAAETDPHKVGLLLEKDILDVLGALGALELSQLGRAPSAEAAKG